MRYLVLLAAIGLAACAPSTVDIPATAAVAIRLTDEAMAANTASATAPPAPTPTAAPAPSPSPAPGSGSSTIRSTDGALMMYVPSGEFIMGYDQGRSDEAPAHTVYLDSFWIDRTEVTVGMYAACIAAGKCQAFGSAAASKDVPLFNAPWDNAADYCAYAGARLPTEAEWEKAARGTDERLYPWGMDLDTLLLQPFNGEGALVPVGSVPDGASPYGVLDMAGSAFEWVADWYSATYYVTSPRDNPKGPETGSVHVIRGGWWEWTKGTNRASTTSTSYRSTYRNGTGMYGHLVSHGRDYYPGAGFRCAGGAQ